MSFSTFLLYLILEIYILGIVGCLMSLITLRWGNVFIRREMIILERIGTLCDEWGEILSGLEKVQDQQLIQKHAEVQPRLSEIRAEISKLEAEYDDKEESE